MREIKRRPMKFAIVITALIMLQSMAVVAQPHINLAHYKPGTTIASLAIDILPEEEPVAVTIRSAKGLILYRDQTKKAHYTKLIDFGQIGNGQYYVDVAYPEGVIRKVVVMEEENLQVKNDSYYIHNSLNRLQDNNKKMLVRLNKNLNEAVTVRIFDSEGNILHEKTGIKDSHYTALFDMSNLTSGVYKLQMISDNFSSSRSFTLD